MVALPQPFDATQVAPGTGGGSTPLPAGLYQVSIIGSEFKATANNAGQMLVIERKVLGSQEHPEFVGATFIQRLNLVNQNQTAVNIAMADLSSICHVTGVMHLRDTTQLHNLPHIVRLDAVPATTAQGKQVINNNVVEYQDMNGNSPGKPANSGVAQPAPAPAAQAPQPQATGVPQPGAWPSQQPTQQAQAPAQVAPQPAPAAWGAPPAGQAPAAAAPAPAAWGAPQAAQPGAAAQAPAAWGAPPR